MKTPTKLRSLFGTGLLGLVLLWPILRAEEAPPPASPPAAETPATAPAKPAEPAPTPAVPDATVAPAKPEEPAASPAPAAPAAEPASAIEKPIEAATAPAAPAGPVKWVDRHDIVMVMGSVTLAANERANDVVVFGGNATVDGKIDGELVVIGGNVRLNGTANQQAVVIGGNLALGPAAQIGGEVVVVGGQLDNPHARSIKHQEVIGGNFDFADLENNAAVRWVQKGLLHGRLLVPGLAWPWAVFGVAALFYLLVAALFPRGVNACAQSLEERPGSTLLASFLLLFLVPLLVLLLLVTVIGSVLVPFLIIGLLSAGLFGKVAILSFLGRTLLRSFGLVEQAGVAVLTVAIGIGLVALLYLVPVLGLLLWGLLSWLGLGMAVHTVLGRSRREKARNAAANAAGTPVSARPTAVAAARVAAPATVAGAPAEFPAASAAPVDPAVAATAPLTPPEPPSYPTSGAGFVGDAPLATPAVASAPGEVPPVLGAAALPPPVAPASPPLAASAPKFGQMPPGMPPISAATAQRADFWSRLFAVVLDVVLVAIVGGASGLDNLIPLPVLFGLYAFALWLWRGTTIGGVIFGLRIVRLDDRPIDPATVLVRVIVGYLSVFAIGLGFLWILWDDQQQTWHDKVAGTIVVRAPKGMSLV